MQKSREVISKEVRENEVLNESLQITVSWLEDHISQNAELKRQLDDKTRFQSTIQEICDINKRLMEEKELIAQTKNHLEFMVESLKKENQAFNLQIRQIKSHYEVKMQREKSNFTLESNMCSLTSSPQNTSKNRFWSREYNKLALEGSPLDLKESDMKQFYNEENIQDLDVLMPEISKITNSLDDLGKLNLIPLE